MNIFKIIKSWKEMRRLKKSVRGGIDEYASIRIMDAKKLAFDNPDREYGEHMMKKINEYDFNRQNKARSVGFGYKRGSNYK